MRSVTKGMLKRIKFFFGICIFRFQLTLKQGLTVFREQKFSAAVCRRMLTYADVCRFQLTLKEGLTVFREQEFTAAVCRRMLTYADVC